MKRTDIPQFIQDCSSIGMRVSYKDQADKLLKVFDELTELREENEQLKNDVAGFASCNRARQAAEAKLATMQKVVEQAKLTIKSFDDVDKSKCRACGEDFTSSYTTWFELEKLKELVEEEK